jgi:putative salt-induced outer membrane protein YdiY
MLHLDRIALTLLLLCLPSLSYAGELRLNNGAVLPGELKSIGPKDIVWKADKIGEVTVAKSDVIDLQTANTATVELASDQKAKNNCLVEVHNSTWTVQCPELAEQPVAYATLKSLPNDNRTTGSITVSANLNRGVNPSDEINIDGDAKWLRPTHRHLIELSVDYETNDGDTTEDQADASYQYDLLRDRGWFWYGRTRYYRDTFQALEQVYSVGGGIGRDFMPVEGLTLTAQGGPMMVYFEYDERGWETEPAAALRGNMTWNTPWRGIKAHHSSEFGYVFAINDGYLFQSETGLTFPLYGGLIAQIRLDYDRSGVNAIDGSDYDIEWVLGLGYTW